MRVSYHFRNMTRNLFRSLADRVSHFDLKFSLSFEVVIQGLTKKLLPIEKLGSLNHQQMATRENFISKLE